LNCATSPAEVEHGPVIHRCAASLGSGRIQIAHTVGMLLSSSRQWRVAELLRRAFDLSMRIQSDPQSWLRESEPGTFTHACP
jgi:hypothetical protein